MAAPREAEYHRDEWSLWGILIKRDIKINPKLGLLAKYKIPFHGTSLSWSQRPFQSAQE